MGPVVAEDVEAIIRTFFFVVQNSFSKKEELCVKQYEVVGSFVTCYVLCNEKGIFQAMFNYVI